MAKFWDKLISSKFSFNDEIQMIEALMHASGFNMERNSIYDAIASNFLSWVHRQNFISLEACMEITGINSVIEKSSWSNEIRDAQKAKAQALNSNNESNIDVDYAANCSTDDYLDYAEFVLNILPVGLDDGFMNNSGIYHALMYSPDSLQYNQIEQSGYVNNILQNIFNTIEGANHTIVRSDAFYRVIPKDPTVLDAATKVSETKPKYTDDILMYGHRNNSKDLKAKGAILARLHIYFEGELKKKLNESGYSSLVSDIGFIANNVPEIRHSGSSKIALEIGKQTEQEKEIWFDKLFTLFICAIELREHAEIHQEIAELKKLTN